MRVIGVVILVELVVRVRSAWPQSKPLDRSGVMALEEMAKQLNPLSVKVSQLRLGEHMPRRVYGASEEHHR